MHDQWSGINDSEDLDSQTESILIADAKVGRQLGTFLEDMTWEEKMAVGLHAYWLTDKSHKQLCQVIPRHGEFSVEVQAALVLVRQLSFQGLIEVASELLVKDWESGADDAPSVTIE
jgi:hypothetical protein